jgi:hypothetical protein
LRPAAPSVFKIIILFKKAIKFPSTDWNQIPSKRFHFHTTKATTFPIQENSLSLSLALSLTCKETQKEKKKEEKRWVHWWINGKVWSGGDSKGDHNNGGGSARRGASLRFPCLWTSQCVLS